MNKVAATGERARSGALFAGEDDAGTRLLTGTMPFARSAEHDRIGFIALIFLIDCLSILFGFTAAGAIRLGSPIEEQGLRALAVVLPMFILLATHNGAYSLEGLERPSLGIRRSMRALLYACAVAIVLLFSLKWSHQFSRLIFGVGMITSLGTLALIRWNLGQYLGRKYHWTFRTRLVIADSVSVTPNRGDCIVFADQLGITPGEDDPWTRHRLGKMFERFDSVVLACPPDRRRKWSYSLQGCAVDVEVLMPELSRLGAVELRMLHGEPTLVISSRPMILGDRVVKRAVDIVVAAIALVVLAPVMLLVALALKLESPGPIFFRQKRVGQNNRMFELLKFRSMHVDCADPGGDRSTSRCDERVTAVGRFIRRTSLDELPQLFNVLKGEMSLVGPRPDVPAQRALYTPQDWQARCSVRPGITGLAQALVRSEATEAERLALDLRYVREQSLALDLRIMWLTLGRLSGKGSN